MGKPKKRRPRRFNCAPGRHSEVAKRKYATTNRIIENEFNLLLDVAVRYASKHAKPYKLQHSIRIVNGQPTVKLIVKRLQQFSLPGKKLHSVIDPQKPKIYVHSADSLPADAYRLFNVGILQKTIAAISQHIMTCSTANKNSYGKSPVSNLSEKRTCGLASVLKCLVFVERRSVLTIPQQLHLKMIQLTMTSTYGQYGELWLQEEVYPV